MRLQTSSDSTTTTYYQVDLLVGQNTTGKVVLLEYHQ